MNFQVQTVEKVQFLKANFRKYFIYLNKIMLLLANICI